MRPNTEWMSTARYVPLLCFNYSTFLHVSASCHIFFCHCLRCCRVAFPWLKRAPSLIAIALFAIIAVQAAGAIPAQTAWCRCGNTNFTTTCRNYTDCKSACIKKGKAVKGVSTCQF